jgi:lipoprotein-anchoring transpeptidase ErfK/SrfK
MPYFPFKLSLCSAVTAFGLVSCTLGPPQPPPKAQRVMYEWYDDGGPGKVAVHINLSTQIAKFKRGGRDIGWCYVATGIEGRHTPRGGFNILEMIEDKHSNRYGWMEDDFGNVIDGDATPSDPVPEGTHYVPAPMPCWMRLTNWGIGMHGGLIPNPGLPASHGCIRLPKDFVPMLYQVVELGTPVTIQ